MAFTGTGFEGTVGETEFSQILDSVADHGVVGTYNDTSMSAAKVIGSRTMLVQPGKVFFPGVLGSLDTATNATAAAAPSPALSGSVQRIDLLVARCDWSGAGTVSLVMKAGTQSSTPVPPSVTQTPGVLFEIPLRQGVLTASVQGEYTTTSMVDRRYWLEAGKYVLPSTTQLPPGRTGAIAYRPDAHQMLVNNGSSWDTFKANSDTGYSMIVSPIGGFTGGTWGRIVNGWAIVDFPWFKGSASIPATNIDITLPDAYKPSIDLQFSSLYAEAPKAPVLVTLNAGSPVLRINGVALNAGARLQGSITYPVG